MKTTEQKVTVQRRDRLLLQPDSYAVPGGNSTYGGYGDLTERCTGPRREKRSLTRSSPSADREKAFTKHWKSTNVFPDYCLHMIALGEESGNLDVCMLSLADYYEKEEAISQQYPGCCNLSVYYDRHDGCRHCGTGQPRYADLRAGLCGTGQ